MKVKIVKIKSVQDKIVDQYYFQFLGEEFEVKSYDGMRYELPIRSFNGKDKSTWWSKSELQFIEL